MSLLYIRRKCEIAHTVRVCVGDEDGINVAEAVFREPLYCSRQEALPDINHDSPARNERAKRQQSARGDFHSESLSGTGTGAVLT